MRRSTVIGLGVTCVLIGGAAVGLSDGPSKKEPMIGHMVYFQLNDGSPASVAKFVAGCDKYLKGHPGEVFYGAGTLAKDLKRPVNDLDWDVALHIVFKTKAEHDKYQDSARHLQFIEEAKSGMKKVRVFDSLIEGK